MSHAGDSVTVSLDRTRKILVCILLCVVLFGVMQILAAAVLLGLSATQT